MEIPPGTFMMGSDRHYPEERPRHRARVERFRLDPYPVTNAEFAAFVADTGHVTTAELPLEGDAFAGVPAAERAPGSLCFTPTPGPVNLRNWRLWWRWQPGANWRHPHGPGSTIAGREHHPVVHVSFTDATAYAAWAGKRLPTEVEWERAAWAGAGEEEFPWGPQLAPGGSLMANTWQGDFPYRNTGANGWRGTSPVGSFPANGFGLFDMIGNVWEWTSTRYTPGHAPSQAAQTQTGRAQTSRAQTSRTQTEQTPKVRTGAECGCGPTAPDPEVSRVTKGGSHLCAPEYCRRYRPAARSPQSEDSATSHLGFRCARDAG